MSSDNSIFRDLSRSDAGIDHQTNEEPHYVNITKPSLGRNSSEPSHHLSITKKPKPGPKPNLVAAAIAKLNMESTYKTKMPTSSLTGRSTNTGHVPPPPPAKTTSKYPRGLCQPSVSGSPTMSVTQQQSAAVPPKPSKRITKSASFDSANALYAEAAEVQISRLPPEEREDKSRTVSSPPNHFADNCIYEEAIPVKENLYQDDSNIYDEAVPVRPSSYRRPSAPQLVLYPGEENLYEEAASVRTDRLPAIEKQRTDSVFVDPEPLYAQAADVLPERLTQTERKLAKSRQHPDAHCTYEEAAVVRKASADVESDTEDEPLYYKLMIFTNRCVTSV